jgi:hypothetical protein
MQAAINEAPTGAMREIGLVAVARGWSVEQLARLYNSQEPTTHLNGKNVLDNIRASRPRRATIQRYAAAIGTRDEHLFLADGEPLQRGRLRRWRTYALRVLGHDPRFLPTISKAALAAWDRDPSFEQSSLREYALCSYRSDRGLYQIQEGPRPAGITDQFLRLVWADAHKGHQVLTLHGITFDMPIGTLLGELERQIDVARHIAPERRTRNPNDDLFVIDANLSNICSDEERAVIINTIRIFLNARGVETLSPAQARAKLGQQYFQSLKDLADYPGKPITKRGTHDE